MPALQEKNKQGDKGGQKQKAKGSSGKSDKPAFLSLRIPRRNEGVLARRATIVILGLLWFVGSYQLYQFLVSYETWSGSWGGAAVPLLQIPLSLALLVAVVLFVGATLISFLVANRADATDFLIETETEMKKVTWPTKDDSINATMIVIATVVVLGLLLATTDFILRALFGLLF